MSSSLSSSFTIFATSTNHCCCEAMMVGGGTKDIIHCMVMVSHEIG
jgi:hypothetical protein